MAFSEWDKYPSDIKENAKKIVNGIQYSYSSIGCFDDYLMYLRKYLNEFNTDSKTDLKYFSKVVCNIVFNGVRSC